MDQYRNISIRAASLADVEYVIRRMRETDRREVYAVRFSDSPEDLIAELWALRGNAAAFLAVSRSAHPRPVALVGVWEFMPGVGMACLMATNDWPTIMGDLTRFLKRTFRARMARMGFRRVEVRAMTDLKRNCRWISTLGAAPEADLPEVGKNGETFTQFAWTKGQADVSRGPA